MLTVEFARQRQRRLLEVLARKQVGAAVIGAAAEVYYFSAHRAFWQHQVGFLLFSDGRAVLISPNTPAKDVVADDVVAFEANWMGTLRQDQSASVAAAILAKLKERGVGRLALDASAVGSQVMLGFDGQCQRLDEDLWQLRRQKDPDELELMRTAIRCTQAMYDRARQIIEPGVEELRVYGELHQAAVLAAGEPLSAYLGNDYACGAGGGPPRKNRPAKSGELYILDLGPAYRGYFADNCRAICVNRRPTDAQHKAWQGIVGVFPIVEKIARPGVKCRDIWTAVEDYYQHTFGHGLPHHLGHGVGLNPHEYPHLNPKWDDTLLQGEVFTAEPGVYGAELAGGLRIENQYRVTAQGVENLTPYPLTMV